MHQRQVLKYALFDFLQPIMLAVQYALRIRNADFIFRLLTPRQVGQRLEIVKFYAVIRVLRIKAFELLQLLIKRLLHFWWKVQIFCLLAQLFHVAILRIAEFALNILNLLLQEIFFLLLIQLFARLILNMQLQRSILALSIQDTHQTQRLLLMIRFSHQFLLFLHRKRQISTDEIDKENRMRNILNSKDSFFVPYI